MCDIIALRRILRILKYNYSISLGKNGKYSYIFSLSIYSRYMFYLLFYSLGVLDKKNFLDIPFSFISLTHMQRTNEINVSACNSYPKILTRLNPCS